MFVSILYKSPFWDKLPLKNRIIKIIGIGVLLYVIIHSLLYSKYFNNSTFTNYRKYIYYIVVLDIITTITIHFNNKNKSVYNQQLLHNNERYIDYNPYYQQNISNNYTQWKARDPSIGYVGLPSDPSIGGIKPNTEQLKWQNMHQYNYKSDKYDNIKLNDVNTQQDNLPLTTYSMEGSRSKPTYNNSTSKSQSLTTSKTQLNIIDDKSSMCIPTYLMDGSRSKSTYLMDGSRSKSTYRSNKKKLDIIENITEKSDDIPIYKPND